jgi:uncharacterized protein (TIGR00725 family)
LVKSKFSKHWSGSLGVDRKFKIAVLGSAGASENSPAAGLALTIGEAVADHGGIILTGGCSGLPHAAVMGASCQGGLTVAVSPAMNRMTHITNYMYPADSDVMIFTGLGNKGRNVILVRSSDACIFVGGGMGTLNEFTIAFDELGSDCVIGLLIGTGGMCDIVDSVVSIARRTSAAYLVADSDPRKLIDKVFDHLTHKKACPNE